MHKQLSKKSHKQTESSVEDFMKHIRKYNLQSERFISPKPLLYMYTNPSRNFTLHTLDKSRSKSKTLSGRKCSNSKKSSSKTIRKKVQKLLSSNLSKDNIHHKKSLSSISNLPKTGGRSAKKSNKSGIDTELMTKSKAGLKGKLNQFKLKAVSGESESKKKQKTKKQKHHFDGEVHFHPDMSSSYRPAQSSIPSQSSQIYHPTHSNPAQLIESYSAKLFKTQLYLQSTKQKLGSFLCRKFQSILNQIVQSLVLNLKKSLNQLQKQVQDRVQRRLRQEYEHKLKERQSQLSQLQKMCEKMTKKFTQMLHKQFYTNSLIYRLRLKGIDIDKEFGQAVWGVDDLGGLGYGNSIGENERQDQRDYAISQNRRMQERKINHLKSPQKANPLLDKRIDQQQDNYSRGSSSDNDNENRFAFHPHPHHINISNSSSQFKQTTYYRHHKHEQQGGLTQMQQQQIINIESQLEEQQQGEHDLYNDQHEQQQSVQEIRKANRSL